MTPVAWVSVSSALCPLLSPLGLRENRRRRKKGKKGGSAGGRAAALRLAFVQLGRAVLISSHIKPRMCAPIIRGYGVTPREQSIPQIPQPVARAQVTQTVHAAQNNHLLCQGHLSWQLGPRLSLHATPGLPVIPLTRVQNKPVDRALIKGQALTL